MRRDTLTQASPGPGTPVQSTGSTSDSRLVTALAKLPGLALALAIATVATVLGHFAPIIGAPVIGIVIGVVLAMVITPGTRLKPGIATASKPVLQLSVVILGSQLSLTEVVKVGVTSLPVMVGTLVICLVAAYLIGRWMGVVGNLRTLIGVGTGICGASAIAAVTPVIGAVGVDVAYAVSTIFLFNITAVLTFPLLGHLLGLSQHSFGLFAGTAVNDMSSVVAASTTYGSAAANYAVVVKLTRTLLIIPICVGLAALAGRATRRTADAASTTDTTSTTGPTTHRRAPRLRAHRLVPWFLIGFLLVAAANSAGLIPVNSHHALSSISIFLITTALSGIGLSTDLPGLRAAGPRPVLLGGALWIIVTASSLGLQFATHAIR